MELATPEPPAGLYFSHFLQGTKGEADQNPTSLLPNNRLAGPEPKHANRLELATAQFVLGQWSESEEAPSGIKAAKL